MTPKQILDSFSETLMQDQRILSAQERALVTNLLQHAKSAAAAKSETHEAVRAIIASAIGETVAQRAFAVLGASIVERIVKSSSLPLGGTVGGQTEFLESSGAQPEHPGGAAPQKQPLRDTPASEPETPGSRKDAPVRPLQPEHPGRGVATKVVRAGTVVTVDRPDVLRANCVVLDEFLAPQELEDLTRFTLDHEADFQTSELYSPRLEKGVINDDYRRSRVLMELGEQQDMMLARINSVLPHALERLGMEEFTIADVEAQITASNDGDFFHLHNDNGSEGVAARHLSFVYFFHREPRQFEGGELRIHDAHLEEGRYVSDGAYQAIVPRQNQIVFFPCELQHEITRVKCPSQRFADSRFTLNGWLRQ